MNAILEIIQRWQDPGPWATVKALATQAAEFDSQAVKLGGDARFLLDRGDIEQARQLKAEADQLRNCAADVFGQRSELASQFMQIENWVREHRPELLEFVPIAQFKGEPSEAIRDLKRLESRIRKPAAAKMPTANRPRRTKPPMPQRKVEEHWLTVMNSGNRDLIQEYLTLAETKLATKIGCSRNTLRAVEAFQQRDIALREFNRQNR
jgi:hypothetical protein